MFTLSTDSIEELLVANNAIRAYREGLVEDLRAPVRREPERMTKARWDGMTTAQRLAFTETEWTEQTLKDLKSWALNVASVLAILDLCSDKPGEWVSFKAACTAAGMGVDSARGQLRALSQKVHNHLGLYSWPVVANPTPPGRGGLGYIMDHTVAARWKAIR